MRGPYIPARSETRAPVSCARGYGTIARVHHMISVERTSRRARVMTVRTGEGTERACLCLNTCNIIPRSTRVRRGCRRTNLLRAEGHARDHHEEHAENDDHDDGPVRAGPGTGRWRERRGRRWSSILNVYADTYTWPWRRLTQDYWTWTWHCRGVGFMINTRRATNSRDKTRPGERLHKFEYGMQA